MSDYLVGYAKKQCSCKECKEHILKDELRIGRRLASGQMQYFHAQPACFIQAEQTRIARNRLAGQVNTQLEYLDTLTPFDKDRVTRMWQWFLSLIGVASQRQATPPGGRPGMTPGASTSHLGAPPIGLATVIGIGPTTLGTGHTVIATGPITSHGIGTAPATAGAPTSHTAGTKRPLATTHPGQVSSIIDLTTTPDDTDDGPSSSSKKPRLEPTPPQKSASLNRSLSVDVCSICLDPPLHPVILPCGHTYCYLCIKGITVNSTPGATFGSDNSSATCSLCRRPIPPGYLESAEVINNASRDLNQTNPGDVWQWFYEGKKGWWKFEARNNEEIEESFLGGQLNLETLICGNIYIIDFTTMEQYQKSYPTRKRKIKRDMATASSIGVAGLAKKGDQS